jgi:cell wall-associated NlpC family hydrolase
MGRRAATIAGRPSNNGTSHTPGIETEDLSEFIARFSADSPESVASPLAETSLAEGSLASAPLAGPSGTSSEAGVHALPAPRSRREARERMRGLASGPVAVDEPLVAREAAPVLPSRRALRQSRTASGSASSEPSRPTSSQPDEEIAARLGSASSKPSRPTTSPVAEEIAARPVATMPGVTARDAEPSVPAAFVAEPRVAPAFVAPAFAAPATMNPSRTTPETADREPRRPTGPVAVRADGKSRARSSRKPALIAGSAALALIPGLMFAAPANAAESLSPAQLKATIDSNSRLIAQKLQVSAAVAGGPVQKENYVAGAIAGIVAAESGPNGAEVAVALAEALQYGGAREKIVETALTYLGDPYELDGTSHSGIDCSGLTMVAYATVGVSLVHYVPSQDAVATPITQAQAQPGDLVFFNDDAHVALYLGGGMIIEAPDYGIPVRIVSLSTWSGIGYHFGSILHD